MKIILVRHGESTHNSERLVTGQMDAPLTPRGEEQARLAAESLKGHRLAIHSSDLSRAMRTAEIIASELEAPVSTHPELRERHYGEWQGRPKSECIGIESPRSSWNPPGSEPLEDWLERVRLFSKRLKDSEQDSLVSAHRGTVSILASELLEESLHEWLDKKEIPNARPIIIRIEDGRGLLENPEVFE
jgi:2,3-bisphosphoglycerate-dependent phosphoglycerate mutase